jgi:RNA polymerase sigma factor (sigma-70 family)
MSAQEARHAENREGSVLCRYQRELFRFLMRRLRDAEDVKDLAQEVYLRLLRVENPEQIVEPLAYVYRTAGNAVTEFRMRQRRERDCVRFDSEAARELTENPLEISPDSLADRLDAENILKRALEQLPPLYRSVLLLRACDGMTYPDIARKLELSVHTVEKYYFKALAMVRTADWN